MELAKHFGTETPNGFRRSGFRIQKQYKLPGAAVLPRTDAINNYFDKRAISEKTLNAFQIGADEHGNILFPFYREGTLVYIKYRKPRKYNPSEKLPKEWAERDACPILFGMDLCEPDKPLIISEGQIDCLALYEAGIRNAVSVPSGCENFDWIEPCWDWLGKFPSIILFGDNDAPGRKMVETLVKRIGEDKCKTIDEYPLRPDGTECKDPNEILFFCGPLELNDMIDSAKEVPIAGLIDVSTIVPEDSTTIERIPTGIDALDASIGGLEESSITIFTGRSSAGKSTATGCILLNAVENGWPVCCYSGELSKQKFLEWILLQAAGSPWVTLKYDPVKKIKVPVVQADVQARILDWLSGKMFLYDNCLSTTDDQTASIISVFTMAARRYGCRVFLVDNCLSALSDSSDEIAAQGKFVNDLKKFALKFKAHVILVAHSRKVKAGEHIGQDDISGNSALVKLANNVIVVSKPDLKIIKNRDSGIERLITMAYCPDSRRVYQADKGDTWKFSWDKTGLTPPLVRADSMFEYQPQTAATEMF